MVYQPKALPLTPLAVEYARRLFEMAEPIARELGVTAAQQAEGTAILAGLTAQAMAKPGEAKNVGALSAAIVQHLAAGRTIN